MTQGAVMERPVHYYLTVATAICGFDVLSTDGTRCTNNAEEVTCAPCRFVLSRQVERALCNCPPGERYEEGGVHGLPVYRCRVCNRQFSGVLRVPR